MTIVADGGQCYRIKGPTGESRGCSQLRSVAAAGPGLPAEAARPLHFNILALPNGPAGERVAVGGRVGDSIKAVRIGGRTLAVRPHGLWLGLFPDEPQTAVEGLDAYGTVVASSA